MKEAKSQEGCSYEHAERASSEWKRNGNKTAISEYRRKDT